MMKKRGIIDIPILWCVISQSMLNSFLKKSNIHCVSVRKGKRVQLNIKKYKKKYIKVKVEFIFRGLWSQWEERGRERGGVCYEWRDSVGWTQSPWTVSHSVLPLLTRMRRKNWTNFTPSCLILTGRDLVASPSPGFSSDEYLFSANRSPSSTLCWRQSPTSTS